MEQSVKDIANFIFLEKKPKKRKLVRYCKFLIEMFSFERKRN